DPSDEDTLSGLEPVPPVNWQTPTPDREPARRERRRRFPRPVLVLVVLVLILVSLAGLAVVGLRRSHFVGAASDGHVAIYQGVPWNLVGSIRLYRLVRESPSLLAAELSQNERK